MKALYTTAEERINWLTHGIGIILSIVGLVVLTVCAPIYGDVWHIVSFSIFGSTLIILYTASTFYHSVTDITNKRKLRVLDHSAIFILIAGTYTPFVLVSLRGVWGWSIFGIIWASAIFGIILKTFYTGRFNKMSIAVYVMMGWLCIIALKEIIANVSWLSIILLFIGGLFYTLGVIFFAWQKLPYNHGIWHLFVLTGSVFHYFSVLFILWIV
jgi:hemolysin III